MQLLKFVPIKLTLFLVLGIIIGSYINVSFILSSCFVFTLLIILGFLYESKKPQHKYIFGYSSILLTTCIGVFTTALSKPKNHINHYSNYTSENPQELHLKITEVLKPNRYSNRYITELIYVEEKASSGEVLLSVSKDSINNYLHIDDEIIVYEKLSNIGKPLNPHEFNYKTYLNELGIEKQLYLKPHSFIPIQNERKTIYGIAASWRNHIIENLRGENFGSDELGIIQALLLGERNDIAKETYNNYKNAGAIHILAVSGLHIGVLLLILQFLLQPITRLAYGRKIKLILIVILLWAFAFLAGLSASIVRAVTMFSFLAYADYLNRPANKFNILALSMFFILLVKPTYLFQVGFQMSYLAVFAILWVYPILQKLWFPKNYILNKLWQLLSVSIAAQLGVLPISVFYFHQFPGLFFISNLLIVPCLGFILAGGIIVILLSLLNILPNFIAYGYNELIKFMNTIIEWIAQQEAFIFKNISFDSIQLILAYIIIVSLILIFIKATFKRIVVLLSTIILFQIWIIYNTYQVKNNESVTILHQSKNTALLYQNGTTATIFSNNPDRLQNIITNYDIGERIVSINTDSLQNSYKLHHRNLFIVDSLAILNPNTKNTEYLLLTQSPNINLERWIDSLQPNFVIADGSNYKSDIQLWRKTCIKKKLPFHYTGEKGALYLNSLKD
ncbi:competence protein ComEC family protein [Cellulophaga baltica]|uniref:ComEC/Rec2 family competence protein n=1 Tax=Cellulophaga TaxID=104264 RepID=UPI001C06CDE2|nr:MULTISPECIES: ComEC/Rec2 family competence protein [Cellulophaga]MBU2995466.1 competence protein ComEC family protein [Cellulophaga baltica]MDO6766860.1 ComEC/Rec2 family competence protein [Cellulophaga sp. 1_MG-2023]